MIATESYTTVKDLKYSIMRKLQLNIARIPYYALYEVCNKKNCIEERFLDDLDNIVDITAVWARETEDYNKRKEPIVFKLYLKIQLYYSFTDNDIDTITMHYVQTKYDVIIGKYKLSEIDIITLASLHLLDNFANDLEKAKKALDSNLIDYIPGNVFKALSPQQWVDKIMNFYVTLNFTSKTEVKLTFLEHLKQNSLWEAHQYWIKVT